MPLSDTSIRNAKAQAKPLKLFDGGGLFLFVTPAGVSGGGSNIAMGERRNFFPWVYIRTWA